MDRRKFLGLLGAAGVALYVPKRSYFFGPWAPAEIREGQRAKFWTPEAA